MKQFLAHLIFTILVIAITLCFADEIDSYTIPPVYAPPDKVVQYDPEPVTTTIGGRGKRMNNIQPNLFLSR